MFQQSKLLARISLLLIICNYSFAQQKIKIISATELTTQTYQGKKITKLIGNVVLSQKDVILKCNRAELFKQENKVHAFGNVHINQGDTVNIYSDSLKYFGNKKQAIFYNNVKLISKDLKIVTDKLGYNLKTKQASYFTEAIITSEDMTLTSLKGIYDAPSKNMYFQHDVKLSSNNFKLYSDTLKYHIPSKTSYFYAYTTLIDGDNIIYCNSGWYNKNSQKAFLTNRAKVWSDGQILSADTIFLDNKRGISEAFSEMEWIDTTNKMIVNSDYAKFYQKEEKILATKHLLLSKITTDDTLFLTADTLRAYLELPDSVRTFIVYHDVKIYSQQLQGICDSLSFSYKDSLIRLFREPILWSNKTQMTADSINLEMKHNELTKINMIKNALIVNQSDSTGILYNQIKGKNIYGFMDSSQLSKLLVNGNGESIYFTKDDSNKYFGDNKAICSDM